MATENNNSEAGGEENKTSEAGSEVVVVPNVESRYVPTVGKEFDSIDLAYDFYNAYGRHAGFSVRKGHVKKDRGGMIVDKIFCCSKEGFRVATSTIQSRPAAQTRCGCKAFMRVGLTSGGKYVIRTLNESHNHEMLPLSMSHRLRSQRRITPGQAAQVDIAERAGLAPRAAMELLSTQVGGIENVGFVREDYSNFLRTKNKKQMQKGDSGALPAYFQKKLCEDRAFFHAIDMDEDDMITNIFWADGQMVSDYHYFGDIVSFDTTFKTNTENRPLALFVGLNHHRQVVVFGVALLYEESSDAFSWLFKTFVNCMHGKEPQTIITDQDQAMAKAINEVLSRTVHRNCIWHLYQNAAKHLSSVFHSCKGFAKALKNCIYNCGDDFEFEEAWHDMIDRFNLSDNEWLQAKYKEREKWSLAYGRNHFCADMLSTQISESMNASIKNALNKQKSMVQLLIQIDVVVARHRYSELASDSNMMLKRKEPRQIQPLFRHACKLYTPTIYDRLEKEAMDIWSYKIRNSTKIGDIEIFNIVNKAQSIHQEHTVTYNNENGDVQCSCKKFEFAGILCRHIFLIYFFKDVNKIPEKYIIKRWRRDAKNGLQGIMSKHVPSASNETGKMSNRYSYACSTLIQIASKSAACQKATDYVMEMAEKMNEVVENIVKGTVFQELPKEVETVFVDGHKSASFENEETLSDKGRGVNEDHTNDVADIDVVEEVCTNEQAYESHPNCGKQLNVMAGSNDEVGMSKKRIENAKGIKVRERAKRAGMSIRRKVDALTQATRKKRHKPVVQNIVCGDDKHMGPPTPMPMIPPSAEASHMFPYHHGQMIPAHHLHSFLYTTNSPMGSYEQLNKGSPNMLQMLQGTDIYSHYSSSSPFDTSL